MKLKLKDFKGIEEGEVDLSPFTVLLGGNNSGKTTVLEAIYLFQNPLRMTMYGKYPLELIGGLHMGAGQWGGSISVYHNYTSAEARVDLENYGAFGFVREGPVGQMIRHHVYYYPPQPFSPNVQAMGVTINGQQLQRPWIGTFSVQENQVIQVFQSLNGQPGNAISPIGTPLFFSSDLIQDAVRFMHSNWIFIANSGAPLEVAKEISEFSNEKYMGLTDEPFINGNALYAYRLDGKRIRLADLGFGIQDYVAVRLLYEYIKPKFILWDDAESHLNPLAIIRVAEWLSGLKDTNVVITTHSLELAQIMLEGVEDRGAAILLSLDKGKLKSKKMTAKELDELRAAGVDARLAEGLLL